LPIIAKTNDMLRAAPQRVRSHSGLRR